MSRTDASTVTKYLKEQLESAKEVQEADDELPLFRGMTDGSEADIKAIIDHPKKKDRFVLHLTDGTKFLINVEPTL